MNAHQGKTAEAIAYLEKIKVQYAGTIAPGLRQSIDILCSRARAHDQLRASLEAILDATDYTAGACSVTEMVGAVLPLELINNARAWLQHLRELESPKRQG